MEFNSSTRKTLQMIGFSDFSFEGRHECAKLVTKDKAVFIVAKGSHEHLRAVFIPNSRGPSEILTRDCYSLSELFRFYQSFFNDSFIEYIRNSTSGVAESIDNIYQIDSLKKGNGT